MLQQRGLQAQNVTRGFHSWRLGIPLTMQTLKILSKWGEKGKSQSV